MPFDFVQVSIELQQSKLVSTHSATVAKKIVGDGLKDQQKNNVEDMRLKAELSVEQHRAKTLITAEAKEHEKQRDLNTRRSRVAKSSSLVSLTGGGQFGNAGNMASIIKILFYFTVYVCINSSFNFIFSGYCDTK